MFNQKTSMANTVSIEDPRDSVLGFLNYRHEDPIEINGKIWPSIERYVLAQSFTGGEEKIRLAKSSMAVAKLFKTTQKIEITPDGTVVKKEVFLSGRAPTQIDFEEVVLVAIRAKFKKTEEKFLKTFPIVFVSSRDPEYAEILTNYRNSIYSAKLRDERAKLDLTSDLPSGATAKYKTLIKVMEKYVSYLKVIESTKKSHPGLYDDALYNMAPKNKANKIHQYLSMDLVMRKMPRQSSLVAKSFEYLNHKFPTLATNPDFQALVGKMWATFRWQILNSMGGGEYHLNLSKKDIKLRPVSRPYRKSEVDAPHLKSLETRTEEYAKLFGTRKDYDALVDHYEKMEPSRRGVQIEKLLLAARKERTNDRREKREKENERGEKEEDLAGEVTEGKKDKVISEANLIVEAPSGVKVDVDDSPKTLESQEIKLVVLDDEPDSQESSSQKTKGKNSTTNPSEKSKMDVKNSSSSEESEYKFSEDEESFSDE